MSDDLVLTPLRRIRDDISEMKMNIVEVKERLGLLEGVSLSPSGSHGR